MRYDQGDGAEGTGMELGGELRYAHAALGLTLAGHGRWLALHEAAYQEWTAGGLLQVELGSDRRGLALRVAPSWGVAASGLADVATAADPAGRLEAELGYGLPWLTGQGVLTPYAALTLAADAARDYRAGVRLEIDAFHLALEGRRREQAAGAAEHAMSLYGGRRF